MSECQKCEGSGWISSQIRTRDGLTVDASAPCPWCHAKPQEPRLLNPAELAAIAVAATEASNALSALPDYPMEKAARDEICAQLVEMCSSPEQVRYIQRRATSGLLFQSWKRCGMAGLRQILLGKYLARDGKQHAATTDYPDGIPSDKEIDQIPEHQPLRKLKPGEPVTENPKLNATIKKLGEGKKL